MARVCRRLHSCLDRLSFFGYRGSAEPTRTPAGLARALVPRSVTVALALPIAERLGAPAPVVAACVVLTGLLGANVAQARRTRDNCTAKGNHVSTGGYGLVCAMAACATVDLGFTAYTHRAGFRRFSSQTRGMRARLQSAAGLKQGAAPSPACLQPPCGMSSALPDPTCRGAQPLLTRCAFRDPIARGLATAGSAHGLGTAALSRRCPPSRARTVAACPNPTLVVHGHVLPTECCAAGVARPA